jgi:predicted phage-related endonuclease
MATTEVIIDEREQWLAERRRGIGGSDAGALFPEDSRYGCPLRLYYDKTNTIPDFLRSEREESILERGTMLEDIVAQLFVQKTALKVRRWPARESKLNPILRVNMDRQIIGVTLEQLKALWPDNAEIQALDSEPGPGYLECKTTNDWEFRRMEKEGVIADYILQTQHGIGVTGYKWGVFAVLEPTTWKLAIFPYVRKENLIAEIQRRAEIFWNQHVLIGVPPTPLAAPDNRCKNCLFRKSCPLASEIAKLAPKDDWNGECPPREDLAELVEELKIAEQIADEKADAVKEIKTAIQEKLGELEHVAIPSQRVRIHWSWSKGRSSWDSKGLEGEITGLKKEGFDDLAARIANCKKTGNPSRSFRMNEVGA